MESYERVKALVTDERYRHIIRFIIVGVINTCVDFIFYSVCVGLFNIHYTIGQVVGYSAGVLNSFILNKFWTFGSTEINKKTTQEFIQFIVVNAVSFGISFWLLTVLIDNFGINKYIAKIMITAVAQVVNYFGYKLWVFKKV